MGSYETRRGEQMSKVIIRRGILVLLIMLLMMSGCAGQSGEVTNEKASPSRIAIASASPGGGFYMGASAVATIINNKIEGVDAVVEITGASKHNVDLLQAGQVQLGMVATEVAWEAWNGKFSYEGQPQDKIRTVAPGWPGVYMFVTLDKHKDINSVVDFDGKPYSSGPKGSSNEVVFNYIMDALEFKPQISNLPTSDAARALTDDNIAGFSIAWPAPSVTELETAHKVKILTLDEAQKDEFKSKYPQYVWLNIPAGTYKALPDGAENVGLYNLVCCRADLSEEFVYELTKALYENVDTIQRVWPQMAEGMAFDNVTYATAPYHIGAVKYFQEQGVDIPEDLLPPEMQ